ncbi:MAG: dephospho-CoA kinase [Pirellulales bacterium]
MKTIGLVGGVASGKSLVAKMFADLGAGLLDADRAGHEVLANDPEVRQAVVDRWGPSVLAADGSIDRSAVAACVFAAGDQAAHERKFLESQLHPRIRKLLEEKTSQFAAAGRPAVVLDAPLLLEAGWGPLCDLIVMVDADRDVRLARAEERGWTAAEFARREAAQWPVEKKRGAAHATLANNGDVAALRTAVHEIWHEYVAS